MLKQISCSRGVGDRLGPAYVLHGLQHLKVHRLGPVPGFFTKVLAEFAGASEGLAVGLFGVGAVVVVVEVLLIRQVAELVRGRHLELVVLQRRQQQRRVLKYYTSFTKIYDTILAGTVHKKSLAKSKL